MRVVLPAPQHPRQTDRRTTICICTHTHVRVHAPYLPTYLPVREGGEATGLEVVQVRKRDLLESFEELGPRVEGRVEPCEAVQEVGQALFVCGCVIWMG